MSAGYIIYSLDTNKFRELVEHPTPVQLAALGQLLSDAFEEFDGQFEEDDPILEWNTNSGSFAQIAAQRLALPDWYSDLSVTGKHLWESVIFNACMNCDDIDVGFRVDNDGIYWDVIEIAWKKLGVFENKNNNIALAAFGKQPFRAEAGVIPEQGVDPDANLESLNALAQFLKTAKENPETFLDSLANQDGISDRHKNALSAFMSDDDDEDDDPEVWYSMHSMHMPDQVQKMLAELKSVEPAMKTTKIKDARRQYEEDLMPALESIVKDRRMLFIQVDT